MTIYIDWGDPFNAMVEDLHMMIFHFPTEPDMQLGEPYAIDNPFDVFDLDSRLIGFSIATDFIV